jgi:FMN-dependent NADH-azoreductase
MTKVLYIEASPRKKRSSSIAVANTFLDSYKAVHPQDEIITVDLWKKELPPFDGDAIDAKYAVMHKQPHTAEQAKAWKAVVDIIEEFKDADKYIISLPMWNFGIPYKLKHYIDLVVQPGLTFSFSPETGYKGLVTGKKIQLIYARGGAYGSGTGAEFLDLQTQYMKTILGFIGFENIDAILVEPTLSGGPEVLKAAKEEAERAAKKF